MKIKRKPICFVISSPSGAGKTSIVEKVLKKESGILKTVSHTTRSKRPGEEEGVQYYFTDQRNFMQMEKSGQMLEYTTIYDHHYGTSRKEIDRIMKKGLDAILVIENEGAQAIKRHFPRSVFIVILPPSIAELKKRIMKRDHTDDDVEKRLKNATREIRGLVWYDYVVLNDDLNESVELVHNIILAERAKLAPIKEEVFGSFQDD